VPRAPHVPAQLRYRPFLGRDAVAAGLLTRRQLVGPSWRRLLPNVYLHRGVLLDHAVWCKGAALLLPADGAISHASAAFLFGVDVLPLGAAVAVSVPRERHLRMRGLLVRRTRLDEWDTRTVGMIAVTTPTRTAFDLARNPDRTEAVVGVDALLRRGVIDLDEVRRYLRARAGWPGADRAAHAIDLARPAESPMETRLRLLLVDGGCPTPNVQYVVGRYRLDLAYPQLKLGIEYDGDHHRERAVFRRDVERLNALRAHGWTVLRFTADDVLRRPALVVAQVVAVVREHTLAR
jgi:very-short-patch-repair endonuclease